MPIENDSILVVLQTVGDDVGSLQPTTFDQFTFWLSFVASIATLIALYIAVREFTTVKDAVNTALTRNNQQIQNTLHIMTLTEACGCSETILEEISQGQYGAASVRLQHLNNAVIQLIENNPHIDKHVLGSYQQRVSSDINSLHQLAANPAAGLYTNNILHNVQNIHDELKKAESKQTNILKNDNSR